MTSILEAILTSEEIMTGPDMEVTLKRDGAEWQGKIVAISEGPAVLLEKPNGERMMIARHGLTVTVGTDGSKPDSDPAAA